MLFDPLRCGPSSVALFAPVEDAYIMHTSPCFTGAGTWLLPLWMPGSVSHVFHYAMSVFSSSLVTPFCFFPSGWMGTREHAVVGAIVRLHGCGMHTA